MLPSGGIAAPTTSYDYGDDAVPLFNQLCYFDPEQINLSELPYFKSVTRKPQGSPTHLEAKGDYWKVVVTYDRHTGALCSRLRLYRGVSTAWPDPSFCWKFDNLTARRLGADAVKETFRRGVSQMLMTMYGSLRRGIEYDYGSSSHLEFCGTDVYRFALKVRIWQVPFVFAWDLQEGMFLARVKDRSGVLREESFPMAYGAMSALRKILKQCSLT